MELGFGPLYSEAAVAAGITTEKADMLFASTPFRDHARAGRSRSRTRSAARRRLLRAAREVRARSSTSARTNPG